MLVIKVSIIVIVGVVFANFFKQIKSEYSMLIGLFLVVLVFYIILQKLTSVMDLFYQLWSNMSGQKEFMGVLMKMLGISYITEISSGICKDAGYQSVSTQIVILGKLTMISMGSSIIISLIQMINICMEM